jgi:hypothetical protein
MMQVDKWFIIAEDDGDPGKSDVENRLSTINVSWLFPCSKCAASAVEKGRVTLLQVPWIKMQFGEMIEVLANFSANQIIDCWRLEIFPYISNLWQMHRRDGAGLCCRYLRSWCGIMKIWILCQTWVCNRILSINELKLPTGLNAFCEVRAPVLEASRTFNVQVKIFFSPKLFGFRSCNWVLELARV